MKPYASSISYTPTARKRPLYKTQPPEPLKQTPHSDRNDTHSSHPHSLEPRDSGRNRRLSRDCVPVGTCRRASDRHGTDSTGSRSRRRLGSGGAGSASGHRASTGRERCVDGAGGAVDVQVVDLKLENGNELRYGRGGQDGTYVCSVVVGRVEHVSRVTILRGDECRTSLRQDGRSSCEITTELRKGTLQHPRTTL